MSVASGPVHVAASRDFVDYALHSQYARDFLQWIKKTKIPDESFFTTLNNHPRLGVPGAYTGEWDKLEFTDWRRQRHELIHTCKSYNQPNNLSVTQTLFLSA